MDVDEALNSLGRFGKWQALFCNLLCITCTFTASWQTFAIIFLAANQEYHCRLPNGTDQNTSVPFVTENGIIKRSSCMVYSNYSSATNITENCPNGWDFTGARRYTIAEEWELICEKEYLVGAAQTVFMLGMMAGQIVCSNVADFFGRKQVFITTLVANAIFGVGSSFVRNIHVFTFLRFLNGLMTQGSMLVGFVLACEMVPARVRNEAGIMYMNWWATGMCLLAGIAYCIPSWHNLLIALSVPGFLGVILIWILPQSLPWLVAKGREVEAKLLLKQIAKFNGKDLPEKFDLTEEEEADFFKGKKERGKIMADIEQELDNIRGKEEFGKMDAEDNFDEHVHAPVTKTKWIQRASSVFMKPALSSTLKGGIKHKYTILDIIRSPTLRKNTIILCYLFMVNSLVYYGLSLNTGNLAGDMYINFLLSGLVEIPANTGALFSLKYIGHRLPVCVFLLIAGVSLLTTITIPETTASGVNLVPVIITLSMVGKCGIAASFTGLYIWGAALFPTTIRNVGLGVAGVVGTTGSILAPFSVFAAKFLWWFPGVVFGVMCLLGGLACLALPETRNKPLPQTIEEVENLRIRQKK